jgi:8-oxo-dGTP pyrophosphatase MutT (NUDIX family)
MIPAPHRPRVLITAGGTREPIDDVRVVANRSTGRLGLALARAALDRGATVTLVGARAMANEVAALPASARWVPYGSFVELDAALAREADQPYDLVLMAAAVADYSPTRTDGKIRSDADGLVVTLGRNPKLLARLRRQWPDAQIVGFKLLSGVSDEELDAVARAQVATNQLDACFANDARRLVDDRHPARLVTATDVRPLDGSREAVAAALIDAFLRQPAPTDAPPAPTLPLASAWRCWRALPPGARVHPPPRTAADLWARPTAPHHPVVVTLPDGAEGPTTRWWAGPEPDAAVLDAALAVGAPLIWHGHVVGALRDDGVVVPLAAPPSGPDHVGDAWLEDLLLDRPRWSVAGDVDWRTRGWRPEAGAWTAPWGHGDVQPAASALCWDVTTGRVLLGRRKRPPVGTWALPGGRSDPGETSLQTALRELEEETGLRPHHGPPLASWTSYVQGAPAAPVWAITSWWLPVGPADAASGGLDVRETDELAPAWMTPRAALRLTPLSPGTRRALLDAAAAGLR